MVEGPRGKLCFFYLVSGVAKTFVVGGGQVLDFSVKRELQVS